MPKMLHVLLFFGVALPTQAAPAPQRSAEIFRRLCVSCHGPGGSGVEKLKAPAIAGLPAWYVKNQLDKFRSGARGKHPKDAEGLRMYPMAKMFGEDDLAGLAEYVGSLPRPSAPATLNGDAARGAAKFGVCVACHGAKAEGNQALNAPPLAGANDWYLFKQLKAFQGGLRGADPARDPGGATMVPMAKTLEDEQAILDVLAHIRSLQ